MKLLFGGLFILGLVVGSAFAGDDWSTTYSLVGGEIEVRNEQANTEWIPIAILWKYPVGTNAMVSVERISQGNTFVLAMQSLTNTSTAVWVADAEYPFVNGDTLRVQSSITNCQVQVIRRGQ